MPLKIFETLRRSHSIEFLIHGKNLAFIQENKYVNLIWLNSILRKKLTSKLENLFRKYPSCCRHFNYRKIFDPVITKSQTTSEDNKKTKKWIGKGQHYKG